MLENLSNETLHDGSKSESFLLTKDYSNKVQFLLNVAQSGDRMIFDINGKKVAIITYKIDLEKGHVYIDFFGTINGKHESHDYKELLLLDNQEYSDVEFSGISYEVMSKFITEVCHPLSISQIYLDADSGAKKTFWKEKIGKQLVGSGLFSHVRSSGFEVCFQIADIKK